MKNLLLDKRNLLTITLLLLVTIIVNWLIFSKQLNYGFRDVDWQVLYYFKLFGNLSIDHLLQEIQVLGVYVPESYYVGLLEKFLGLNFSQLYQVTHFFKIISAISVYVLIFKIFDNKLLAFTSSLIYTISYTHAGTFFQLSSGGYFLTNIALSSFLVAYHFSLTEKENLKSSIIASLLLIITLALKPERMYPMIALIFLVEFFVIALTKFKKEGIIKGLKRIFVILSPLIIFSFLSYPLFTQGVPSGFAPNQFSVGASVKFQSILNGNLQLLIDPFASLGSSFLYGDHWKLLGQLNFQSLGEYIFSLIFGPVLKMGLIAFFILPIIQKKPLKLTLFIAVLILIFGIVVYMVNLNWQNINQSTRIHFDPNLIALPAIFGFYLLIINCVFFIKWLENRKKIFLAPILGITFAFLFILLTWIPADIILIFMGPHRYLSIPSIGTSLFIAGLLVISFEKLKKGNLAKQFSWITFLILTPLLLINYQVANEFFEYELTFAGVRGNDQTRMKNRFRELNGEIKKDEKSLFYFDESADSANAYSNEGTLLAGFEYWVKFNKDGSLNIFPDPGMLRSTRQCPQHTHQSCLSVLKEGLSLENKVKGFWYRDPIRGNIPHFYKLDNFYAFRFINKDLINIREDVLRELGL